MGVKWGNWGIGGGNEEEMGGKWGRGRGLWGKIREK